VDKQKGFVFLVVNLEISEHVGLANLESLIYLSFSRNLFWIHLEFLMESVLNLFEFLQESVA